MCTVRRTSLLSILLVNESVKETVAFKFKRKYHKAAELGRMRDIPTSILHSYTTLLLEDRHDPFTYLKAL